MLNTFNIVYQMEPIERKYVWRDPPHALAILKRFHGIYISFALIILVFLIPIWLALEKPTTSILVYLLGLIILRFFMPPVHRWVNPPKRQSGPGLDRLDQFLPVYIYTNVCWYVYGVVMWALAIEALTDTINRQSGAWMLLLCVYLIDVIIGCCLYYQVDKMEEKEAIPV